MSVTVGFAGLVALATACSASPEDVELGPAAGSLAPQAKGGTQAVQLNLSHIECTDDGMVNAHFVLLFYGSGNPGGLTGTYQDDLGNVFSFEDPTPDKNTGNVWHYNVTLPEGYIDITSASAGGTTLHNPSAYAADFECGTTHDVCRVEVASQSPYCTDQPLGNPKAECDAFGLDVLAKWERPANGNWGTSYPSPIDALLAIVKTGTGGCGPGQSSYAVYANVQEGDILATPVYGEGQQQAISHITFCACPADQIVEE